MRAVIASSPILKPQGVPIVNRILDILSWLISPIPTEITNGWMRFLAGALQWLTTILIISVGAAIALGILLGVLELLSILGGHM